MINIERSILSKVTNEELINSISSLRNIDITNKSILLVKPSTALLAIVLALKPKWITVLTNNPQQMLLLSTVKNKSVYASINDIEYKRVYHNTIVFPDTVVDNFKAQFKYCTKLLKPKQITVLRNASIKNSHYDRNEHSMYRRKGHRMTHHTITTYTLLK